MYARLTLCIRERQVNWWCHGLWLAVMVMVSVVVKSKVNKLLRSGERDVGVIFIFCG